MDFTAPISNYPLSSQGSLASQYVGQRLEDLPTPAIILDRYKIKKNCAAMLQVCQKLNVGFRAHVKSHKTSELSKLQVGETGPANFIVSTVMEAEQLCMFVAECQSKGREASVSQTHELRRTMPLTRRYRSYTASPSLNPVSHASSTSPKASHRVLSTSSSTT
jgi:hypothetical protein